MIPAVVSRPLVLFAALLGASQGSPVPHSVITLRFHHLHYRAIDPGHALGDAAERLGGTRVMAAGLGVGVRVDRQYVLIERDSQDRRRAADPQAPARAYADAHRWLISRGVAVAPATLADTAVGSRLSDVTFDHIGFAADDIDVALKHLRMKPLSRTENAARFRLPNGVIVEIVRDTDRPDAFWCPMHPDVRSPAEGKCPLCLMALVPIPPPRVGEYQLDAAWIDGAGRHAAGARFTVRDPVTGDVVKDFLDVHERRFHLFVVSRDLARFEHVHPQSTGDGTFELRQPFASGAYIFIADFLPAAGTPQMVQRTLVTPDYEGPLFAAPAPLPDLPREQVVGGLRIRLEASALTPRRPALLRVDVADAMSGVPVNDLEPYLGAAGHLLIVNADATLAAHAHPDGPLVAGPSVTFAPVLPAPGRYKLWVQIQRKGEVVTAPFVIEVQELR